MVREVSGSRTVNQYKTEFNPEKHMLPVGNDYKSSTIEELKRPITDDGRCVGIIETAVSYYTKLWWKLSRGAGDAGRYSHNDPEPELLKEKGRSL
jgi:hypothetical protein